MSCFRVPLHNNPGEADDIKNLVIMKRLLAAADQGTLCRQPESPSTRFFRVVVQPNINDIENGSANARVNVIDNGCRELIGVGFGRDLSS